MKTRIKHFLVWLRWKLFADMRKPTCCAIEDYFEFTVMKEYRVLGIKLGFIMADTFFIKYPKHYKQLRRDLMWRFLVKGER